MDADWPTRLSAVRSSPDLKHTTVVFSLSQHGHTTAPPPQAATPISQSESSLGPGDVTPGYRSGLIGGYSSTPFKYGADQVRRKTCFVSCYIPYFALNIFFS